MEHGFFKREDAFLPQRTQNTGCHRGTETQSRLKTITSFSVPPCLCGKTDITAKTPRTRRKAKDKIGNMESRNRYHRRNAENAKKQKI